MVGEREDGDNEVHGSVLVRTAGGQRDDDAEVIADGSTVSADEAGSSAEQDAIVQETPLPRGPMATVIALQLAEAWNIVMLFPFVVFMVQEELGVESENMVGVYAGLIGCVWSLGQFVSATMWGYASDTFGRRPVLLFGTFGASCAALVFGTSKSVLQAALSRFVGGVLNGNIAVLKSVIGDVTDATNQARGFSLMSLMWGFGAVLAPALGGMLARPADNELVSKILPPSLVSSGGLLVRFPYLLPCILQFVVGLIGFTVCALCLPETRWKNHPTNTRATAAEDHGTHTRDDEVGSVMMEDLENNTPSEGSWGGSDDEEDAVDRRRKRGVQAEDEEESVFSNAQAMASTIVYGLVAFTWVINDEVFPLFCASDERHGGMDFTSSQIGLALGWSGVVLITYQLTIFTWMANRFGLITLFRTSALMACVIFLITPVSGLVRKISDKLGWAVLLTALLARTIAGCGCFTCVMVLVNNSASSASQRGKVNGVGQTFASLARGLGPAIAGTLWSVSVRFYKVPGHQWLPFILASAGAFMCWLLSFRLSPSIESGPSG